ncbi:MAG: SCO family protein [Acidisphaera sp.]|nr:SCO family protein [Acidisphaera sp.]
MTRLLLLLLLLATPAWAVPDLSGFAYQQRQGSALPADAEFRDESGKAVRLGELLGRPVILVLGYFHCPNLCGVVRDDLFSALAGSGLRTPADYTLVALSIDPAETAADAAAAKAADLARFPTEGADRGWHFLTGSAEAVQRVADAVGFRDAFDPRFKQFIHPAGAVFATGSGVVSGYLLGVGYQPGDVRAAVLRAGSGGIARASLPVLLLCFHYDPATGRYTLAITRLYQIAAGLFVLTAGGLLVVAFRWERRRA